MGALNVFCMISGIIMAGITLSDFFAKRNWSIVAGSAVLSAANLYLAFEPAISGRVPFVA